MAPLLIPSTYDAARPLVKSWYQLRNQASQLNAIFATGSQSYCFLMDTSDFDLQSYRPEGYMHAYFALDNEGAFSLLLISREDDRAVYQALTANPASNPNASIYQAPYNVPVVPEDSSVEIVIPKSIAEEM